MLVTVSYSDSLIFILIFLMVRLRLLWSKFTAYKISVVLTAALPLTKKDLTEAEINR